MRLVLRAAFDRYSGYGNDAVDIAVNLARLGVDVTPWPTGVLGPLPREFTRLLEKDPSGRKDVCLQFSDPATLTPWDVVGFAPATFGWTMWERTPLTRADLPWGRRSRRWSAHGLTGLAVTTPMNLDAFAAVDPHIPMKVVPCGVEPGDWPVRAEPRAGPLRFLLLGVLTGRKAPFVLLEAWRQLLAEDPGLDVELVVHTFSPGLHPGVADAYGPKIRFSSRPLTRAELLALYHDCDVLVSVSQGEGNNKPAMEFMATGGTVLASDWSGHRNWLHENTIPLPGWLAPAPGAPPGVQSFQVDPERLVDRLRWAAHRPERVRAMGMACAPWIRDRFAWPVLLPRLLEWMERAADTGGQRAVSGG